MQSIHASDEWFPCNSTDDAAPSSSSNNSCVDTFPWSTNSTDAYSTFHLTIISSVVTVLSLVTAGGNLLVMISFKMDRQLQTVSNYFLLSLSVADFAIGFVSMPLYTVYLLMKRWPLGPVVCDAWLSIDYTVSNASVANLLIISFDRYFSVTRPLTYRAKRTPRQATTVIIFAWLISAALWTPWIIAWPYIEGKREVPENECYIQFLRTNQYLTVITAIAAFYLPVFIMCVIYYRIYRETQKRQKGLLELQATKQIPTKCSESDDEDDDGYSSVAASTRRDTTVTTIGVGVQSSHRNCGAMKFCGLWRRRSGCCCRCLDARNRDFRTECLHKSHVNNDVTNDWPSRCDDLESSVSVPTNDSINHRNLLLPTHRSTFYGHNHDFRRCYSTETLFSRRRCQDTSGCAEASATIPLTLMNSKSSQDSLASSRPQSPSAMSCLGQRAKSFNLPRPACHSKNPDRDRRRTDVKSSYGGAKCAILIQLTDGDPSTEQSESELQSLSDLGKSPTNPDIERVVHGRSSQRSRKLFGGILQAPDGLSSVVNPFVERRTKSFDQSEAKPEVVDRLIVTSQGVNHTMTKTIAEKAKRARKQHQEKKQEKKAAKTLSAILLAFIVTWTPYNVFTVLQTFCPGCLNPTVYAIGECVISGCTKYYTIQIYNSTVAFTNMSRLVYSL